MTNLHANWADLPPVEIGPFRTSIRPKYLDYWAFDPGGSTGFAHAIIYPDCGFLNIFFNAGQIGPEEHHWELFDYFNSRIYSSDAIVYEAFEFRQGIGSDRRKVELISREYIGIIKLIVQGQYMSDNLTVQSASQAKTFCPDKGPQQNAKLKALNLFVPGYPHAMDAYRHLLRDMIRDATLRQILGQIWKEKLQND